jgi:hypothetical protein
MTLASVVRMSSFRKVSALALATVLFALVPGKASASTFTYDLTLTDTSNPTYSGTGTVVFNTQPTATYTNYSADVTSLSFLIDGITYSQSDSHASLTAFEFSQLSPTDVIWDITFSDTVGTSPNRLELASTSGYLVDYNNLQSQTYGTFGVATFVPSAATPEPSSLVLFGTGMLGLAAFSRRRFAL